MYVVTGETGQQNLNVVIESKGVQKDQDLRGIELDKINSAHKLFNMIKQEGIKVNYRKQTNNEKILNIINDIIDNH